MKANLGGTIDPELAVGRNDLIEDLWTTLERQSVSLTAERRIGKTTVLRKMEKTPLEGWVAVYRDLEKYHGAAEFALGVSQDVERFLTQRKRAAKRTAKLFKGLAGTRLGAFELPRATSADWKVVLTSAIEDLAEQLNPDEERLLFLWDEVPFMLGNIRDREGDQRAMEVLDLLRSLRQTHKHLRMVMTGSIGLHHVLEGLRNSGYAGAPVNDMATVEVPPLAQEDAIELARLLVKGENLSCPDFEATCREIAETCDGFPFYIHHIVWKLRRSSVPVTPRIVRENVTSQLLDANDPWQLRHYDNRIPGYYGIDREEVVRAILDFLATETGGPTTDAILAHLKGVSTFADREALLVILRLLGLDHYLARDESGYRFRFPLLRRWWKLSRDLADSSGGTT